jgi:hypothetical protein
MSHLFIRNIVYGTLKSLVNKKKFEIKKTDKF